MQTSLEKLSQARQWLSEAKTLEDVKHIANIAEAARVYARAAKLGLEAQNEAAEIKLRAERMAGEMLAQLDHGNEGRPKLFHAGIVSEYSEVLQEQEIPNTTAHRWQKIAEVPERSFENYIEERKEAGDEITTAGALRLSNVHVSNNSGINEWYTPPEYIASANIVMEELILIQLPVIKRMKL